MVTRTPLLILISIFCGLLLPQALLAREYKALVIGDFHYNEDHLDNVTSDTNCRIDGKHEVKYTSDRAPWGRFGCDAPYSLVRSSIIKAKKMLPNPEFILVIGDLAAHKVSCTDSLNCDDKKREKLRRVLTNVTKELSLRFPMTPIIYTPGNTDMIIHNQVPKKDEKKAFYKFLYDIYIKNHPGNRVLDNSDNRNTFMDGAYFYHDVNSKVRVLSINSLYFFKHNNEDNDKKAAKNEMEWIESQLKSLHSAGRRAVILMHVPKDIDKSEKQANLWVGKYRRKYDELMVTYKDVVDLTITGHFHIARHRVHVQLVDTPHFDNIKSPFVDMISPLFANITYEQRVLKEYKYVLYHSTYVFRAVAPLNLNNPGFSYLHFDDNYKSKRIEEYTFDTRKSINATMSPDGGEFWTRLYDTETGLGLKDLSMEQLLDLHRRMLDYPPLILRYLMYSIGYSINYENMYYALDAFKNKRYLNNQEIGISYICPFNGFEECVMANPSSDLQMKDK